MLFFKIRFYICLFRAKRNLKKINKQFGIGGI